MRRREVRAATRARRHAEAPRAPQRGHLHGRGAARLRAAHHAGGDVAALALEGVIDINAERSRLAKEIAPARGGHLEDRRQARQPDFLARAKEEVVDEQRERREEAIARLSKLQNALERL